MSQPVIQIWLQRTQRREMVSQALSAVLSLLVGTVVVFVTFWFLYVVIFIGQRGASAFTALVFSHRLRLSHDGRLIGSAIGVALLFIGHIRTRPEDLGDYPKRDYRPCGGLGWALGPVGALGVLLAYPGASSKMIADLLFTGPRLMDAAWRFALQTLRLARLDVITCSTLVGFLLERGQAVSYEELAEAGWEPWFAQMRRLRGVVFLEKGLSLTDDLRSELAALETQR